MVERILVTGGTGKTGRLVAAQLAVAGVEAIVATRHPRGPADRLFDWSRPEGFAAALDGVDGVYLVAPTDRTDHLAAMRPLLALAVARVPGQLVLLSASPLARGGPLMGEVHAWLADHAPRWTVLRPSWFMQNFVTERLPAIVHQHAVISATDDGRVPFIDAADIAASAVAVLTDPDRASREHILTGPETLSYGDVAALLSDVTGRTIRHHRLSTSALAAHYVSLGLAPDYAPALAAMDAAIAGGSEDRLTTDVAALTGRPPRTLRAFLEAHRALLRGEES